MNSLRRRIDTIIWRNYIENLLGSNLHFNISKKISAAGFKSRIANHGELAKKKEFPYIVSLKYNNKHFCGGSLISKNHVLTAAHCVTYFFDERKYAMEFISVEAGMIRQGTGKTYNVKRISYHPKYKSIAFQNDLAVVHVSFKNSVIAKFLSWNLYFLMIIIVSRTCSTIRRNIYSTFTKSQFVIASRHSSFC